MVRVSDWLQTSLIVGGAFPPLPPPTTILGGKVPGRSVREPRSLDQQLPRGRLNPRAFLPSAHEGDAASRKEKGTTRHSVYNVILAQHLENVNANWKCASKQVGHCCTLAGLDPPLQYFLLNQRIRRWLVAKRKCCGKHRSVNACSAG